MRPRDYYSRVRPSSEEYICTICKKILRGAGNMCQHVKKHETELKQREFSNSSLYYHVTAGGKKIPIQTSTVDIINWRCKKAIPYRAIDDDDFRKIVKYPEAVLDRKTMAIYQKDISNQMLQKTFDDISQQVVSISLDGGTVLHTKWIVIASLSTSGEEIRFKLLDAIAMEDSCTTANIIKKIEELQTKLRSSYSIIIAACTDNASNFAGCFNNSIKNSSLYIKSIVRVSCACHTGQLMLVDLAEQDSDYNKIIKSLSEFSIGLCHKSARALESAKLSGYPPSIQPQRWNSYHDMLVYVNKNFEQLAELFPETTFFQNAHLSEEIEETIRTVHEFTTALEGDSVDQTDVYIQSRILLCKLEVLANNNSHAKKLLEIARNRFVTTLDLKLSEAIFYFSSEGINEFADNFRYVQEVDDDSEEADTVNARRLSKIRELKPKISFLCDAWNIETNSIIDLFLELTKKQHIFAEKYPKKSELLDILPQTKDTCIIIFDRFIQRLRVLPASEASAERIFAAMRDLFNDKMKRMKPDTLRSTLIINYNTSRNKILGK